MKNHLWPLGAIAVVIVLALSLTSCEKERPVPTPVGTPAAGQRAPQANVTKMALPLTAGDATPVSAAPEASTVPTPLPLSENSGGGQATAGSDQYFLYTVAKGDTLAKIAQKFNVTSESIVSLNDLANPNIVVVGKQLKIPGQTPGGSAGGTYTVKSGETLFSIASRYGVSMKELQTLNNISDPDQVYAGQVLKLPSGETSGATSTGGKKTYTVQRGDTLYSIAVRNGVTTAALQSANSISDPDQIKVGQVLTIP